MSTWTAALLGDDSIPEPKRAFLRSRLTTRRRDMIAGCGSNHGLAASLPAQRRAS